MRWPGPVSAGVVTAVVMSGALALGHQGPAAQALERFELWTLDARFRLRGETPTTGEVALVALDDQTLREAPELLQKRAGFAAVVDAVHAAGARVIGIDAFFAEPESPLDPGLTADVGAFVDDPAMAAVPEPAATLLRRVREETRGDDVLERALAAAPTVLALHAGPPGPPLDADVVRRARYGQVGLSDKAPSIPVAASLLSSLPRFNRAAQAVGLVTVDLDDDQVGRRLAAARRHGDAVLAPLAVHVAARLRGISAAQVGYLPGEAVALGPRRVAVDDDSLLLQFRGNGSFSTYSAVDVVRGRLPPGALEGRAVLIGFTYLSHDVSPTPFDGSAPGLEVHATAVDNLLAGDPLRRAPAVVDAAWSLLLGLLAALLYSRLGPQRAAGRLALSVVLVGAAVVVGALLLWNGVWIAVVGPGATALLVSTVALVMAHLTEGAERRRLRKAFAHYLADEIIDELMSNPLALALGGARRDVTLLFSDIRGFTSLSEQMEPVALSTFLNGYLTPMTRAVLQERGFVDKYVGDALMAVFGAPAPTADHPDRALAAALQMHRQLEVLRATTHPGLQIGIGLNTGEVVAGNMGSEERFDYTVIGDAVNLASRLEGLTKRYGVFCIAGDDTRLRAGSGFRFRELDLVRVKGRARPVAIHELLGGKDTAIANYEDVDRWALGLSAFRAGQFVDARAHFGAFRDRNPKDAVVGLYLERLAGLGEKAPEGWDGVVDHREK